MVALFPPMLPPMEPIARSSTGQKEAFQVLPCPRIVPLRAITRQQKLSSRCQLVVASSSASAKATTTLEQLKVKPIRLIEGTVKLPASKSILNRSLLLAALAEGTTTAGNLLDRHDIQYLLSALKILGVQVEESSPAMIHKCPAQIPSIHAKLFLGNARTALRPPIAAEGFLGTSLPKGTVGGLLADGRTDAYSWRVKQAERRTAVVAARTILGASVEEGQMGDSTPASGEDLLIVGPGVLGSYLGKTWLESFPEATVIGQTNSTANHERLKALGITPRTKEEADSAKFPYVVFSAPPSGSTDYPAEVEAALKLWDGSGSFVFTSSAGVYSGEEGVTTETSPVANIGENERNDRILKAEQMVLAAGGNVVRLVGLYHAHRGAHTFFLRMGEVPRWAGYTVNLIHYEDAALLALAVLKGGVDGPFRSQVFLGADGHPLTFQEMMDATLASGAFEGRVTFTGSESGNRGKRVDNSWTRKVLGWCPRYSSYQEFMTAGAKDFYTSEANAPVGAPHS